MFKNFWMEKSDKCSKDQTDNIKRYISVYGILSARNILDFVMHFCENNKHIGVSLSLLILRLKRPSNKVLSQLTNKVFDWWMTCDDVMIKEQPMQSKNNLK